MIKVPHPQIYDVALDAFRPVCQEDLDRMLAAALVHARFFQAMEELLYDYNDQLKGAGFLRMPQMYAKRQ